MQFKKENDVIIKTDNGNSMQQQTYVDVTELV
jgi:hypothetical protein